MIFQRYNSIDNHTNKKINSLIKSLGLCDESIVWTAREKVHGANFSIRYNGTEFKCGRRSDFLDFDTDQFFGYQNVLQKYQTSIDMMYDYLIETNKIVCGQTLTLFGELAGEMPSGKKVQSEVDYGPIDLYLFDMICHETYVTDFELEVYAISYGLKTAPLLELGSFEKVTQAVPVDLQSVVRDLYSFGNKIDIRVGTDNIAEGYVLKPNNATFFPNGSRVILKCKNEKFSEGKGKARVNTMFVPLSEKDANVLSTLDSYITENRLKNVLSKYGTPLLKDFGVIVKLLMIDVKEQIVTDDEIGIESCDDISAVNKEFGALLSKLIRPNWVNICEGTF